MSLERAWASVEAGFVANVMGSLFVSHSSQDSAEVAQLCEWLSEQGFRSFFLDFHPERGFAAGAQWEAELYAQLRRADAVLFVGSPAAVESHWCFAELAMTRSLGKTIIPVAIRRGGSHPLLADTQTVDLTGADERGYERLHRRLSAAELDPERVFDWNPTRSPFPGLESFQERDAAVFFGRQAETEQLLAQMRSTRRRYTGRLIAVVGPSGSGKSSLVRAGLLPRLRRAQPPWVVLSVLRPADRPLHQLGLALVDAFRDVGASRSLQSVELALHEDTAGLVALTEQLSDLYPGASKPALLVFVDQAEELISSAAGEEHARFLALLYAATRNAGPLWSLLTLRSEFLSAFLHAEQGEFAFDDQLLVGPLDGARLAEVIERPADRAGVSFAAGLVGRMAADTGGGDALPLLAHTLAALHERAHVRGTGTITIGDYEDLGGVVGALRRSANEEHRRLSERGVGALVLPTLSRLVTVGPEGQPTRRRLARAAFRGREDEVVEAFIDARLLTSTEIDGESVVEVAHEALLRQWPPLADVIERDREALQLRSELERQAQDWQRSGRREEYLLLGKRLTAASRLML
jgi:energy-coupling factor transporter ATP-binding protein EcfA2